MFKTPALSAEFKEQVKAIWPDRWQVLDLVLQEIRKCNVYHGQRQDHIALSDQECLVHGGIAGALVFQDKDMNMEQLFMSLETNLKSMAHAFKLPGFAAHVPANGYSLVS